MELAIFLILFPLIPAVLLLFTKNDFLLKWVVILSSAVIAAASIWFAFNNMHAGGEYSNFTAAWANNLIILGDIVIALVFLYVCRRLPFKRYWIPLMVVLQYGAVLLYDFMGKIPETAKYLYVDSLSAIMALVIGIVGTLIAIYTVGYMKHYHKEHPEVPDRTRFFLATIFMFFSAMFGIVFSNSITWIYLFWEVTTLCSFIMIRYSLKPEAIHNAFRALWMLLLGGLAFSMAIIYLANQAGTIELQQLLTMQQSLVLLPVLLICFAGMNKAALYPFGSWLLGAMVAPTPSSALLHSSTMVKAGVYIVMRCAPILKGTVAGEIVALIGGLSFVAASALAISQNDGKRILAYSTIANLGLIVLCAGIGTSFALWAGALLIIFHAVAKALMFLCVGTVEHQIGSRFVEDMQGLISKMPWVTLAMLIGISGMFLAPFGMLISKWAVIEALAHTNPMFPPIVIFGGSLMLFFWTKWMGKLVTVTSPQTGFEKGIGIEWVALGGLSILTIAACACFPLIGKYWLIPLYGWNPMIHQGIEVTVGIMLALMIIPPVTFLIRWKNLVHVKPYLAGINVDDPGKFMGSLGAPREWSFRNYYINKFFSEAVLMKGTMFASIILFIFMFFVR
ncbi:MAG: proton-conducting transporter membrane subunit [Gammaproteobacteria bacterium]|jgi:ech hydrogenase subunit A